MQDGSLGIAIALPTTARLFSSWSLSMKRKVASSCTTRLAWCRSLSHKMKSCRAASQTWTQHPLDQPVACIFQAAQDAKSTDGRGTGHEQGSAALDGREQGQGHGSGTPNQERIGGGGAGICHVPCCFAIKTQVRQRTGRMPERVACCKQT